ncbi:MAG: lamin tail domain-containing protein, partial [Verrucomicrobiales bacterium]
MRFPLLLVAAVLFAVPISSADLIITEFMASNQGALEDQDGDSSDWLEIFNSGAAAVDLGGHYLTDDVAEPQKWVFPEHSLAPNGFVLVFASGKN